MNKYINLFLILIFSIYNHQLSAKYNTNPLKISIIIPCDYKHAYLLDSLLKTYEAQTKLPDEIIISLSQVNQVPNSIIKKLQNEQWAFPVKLLLYENQQSAGQNRNNACNKAIGDIFICQDADDIPHPQRVEIINYLFETYNIDHLIHSYCFSHELDFFKAFDPQKITPTWPKNFDYMRKSFKKFHNGNIAISRNVFKKIQWSNKVKGQDVEFNRMIYDCDTFNLCITEAELIIYRNELSSWIKTS